MKKLFATFCAAAMAVTGVATTTIATNAAPIAPVVRTDTSASMVQDVQYRRYQRRGFYRDRGRAYYNGHRGYRSYRRGYRRHNDFWFPAGAFIAGAIIGGALSNPGPRYVEPRRVYRGGGGSAHVRWCYNRYRSYDSYSNTYQPYGGPRRTCYSPYS